MRFTEEQGRAVVSNFFSMLETTSQLAQQLKAGKGEVKSYEKYSGIAVDLYYKVVDMIDEFGYSITGESLERVAIHSPEMSDPRYFYPVEQINNTLQDMQELYYNQMEGALTEMCKHLEKEAEAEEKRKQEQEEARQRAREQAEQARRTEEKYNKMGVESAQTSRRGFGSIARNIARSIIGLFRR